MGKRKRMHNHKETDEATFENSEEENHPTFEKRTRSHHYGQSCLDSPPPISLSSTEVFQPQHTATSQEWQAGLVHSTASKAQPLVTEGNAVAITSHSHVPNGGPAPAQNEAGAFGRTGCNDECNNVCRASSVVPCTGGRSLRISARVQNKQRREEERDLAASHPHKKIELTDDEEEALVVPNKKQRRRQWELWSTEDKDFFFEAINECGKNFESIQNFLSTKMRKKGLPGYQVKNKDQVRHFYYRTWHKIAKYISFSGVAKKSTQEVYGLVNYGEFRRRVGGTLDSKRGLKLRELVLHGSTSLRLKGRSIRIRTPLCRALKRFHQPWDRGSVGQRLPCRVSVSLSAASHAAWSRVQGLAHNPRVRAVLPLDKPLRTLLQHLAAKWRAAALKMRDSLSSSTHFKVSVPPVSEPTLRLLPPPNASITLSKLTQRDVVRPVYFSLLSHEAWLQKTSLTKSLSGSNAEKGIDSRRRKHLSRGGAAGGDRGFQEGRQPHHDTEGGATGDVEDISQEETEGSDGDELLSGEDRPPVKSSVVGNGYQPLPTSEEECVLSPDHPALRSGVTSSLITNTTSSSVGASTDPLTLDGAVSLFNVFSPEGSSSSRERYCSTALEICDIKSGERISGGANLGVAGTTSHKTLLKNGGSDIISVISSTSGGGDIIISCGFNLLDSTNSMNSCDKDAMSAVTTLAKSSSSLLTLNSDKIVDALTTTNKSSSSLTFCSEFVNVKEESRGYEDDAVRQLLALESAAEGAVTVLPHPSRASADTEDDDEDEEDEEEDAEADDEDDEDEEEIEELEDDDEDDDHHHRHHRDLEEDHHDRDLEDLDHGRDDNEEEDRLLHHHDDEDLDQGRDDNEEEDHRLLHHQNDEGDGEHIVPSEEFVNRADENNVGRGQGEGEDVTNVGAEEVEDVKLLLEDNKENGASVEDQVSQEELESKMETVRRGWTVESVGRLTVGELFIMLGQKEPLQLHYEFDEAEREKKEESNSGDIGNTSSNTSAAEQTSSEQLPTVPLLSPAGKKNGAQFPPRSLLSPPPNSFVAPARPIDSHPEAVKSNTTSSPNKSLSGMLEQLLSMSRQLFQNKSLSVDGNMGCICGGSKGLRSPRGGGVARSPRGAALRSPDVGGRAVPALGDRSKPTSAKRLIAPDSAEETSSQTQAETPTSPCHDTAEFRVPAPPRPLSTQAAIEAQLAVLPRYNHRNRGRLAGRKHVVVQRQLPLLPKQQPSSHCGGAPLFLTRPHYRPLQPKPLLFPPSIPRQQGPGLLLLPSPSSTLPSPTSALPSPSSASPAPLPSNAISVNVSGKQLLTVRLRSPPPSSPASTSISTASTSGDSLDSQSRITVKILCSSASDVADHAMGNSLPITVSVGSPLANNASILGLPSRFDLSGCGIQSKLGLSSSGSNAAKDELNTPPVTPSPGPSPSPGFPYSPSLPHMTVANVSSFLNTASAQASPSAYSTNTMPSGISFTIGGTVYSSCPSAHSRTTLATHCTTSNLMQEPCNSHRYILSGQGGIMSSSADQDVLIMSNSDDLEVTTSCATAVLLNSAVQSTPVRYRAVECTPASSPTQSNSLLNTPKFCPHLASNAELDLLQSATKNISSLLTASDGHVIPQLHIPDDSSQLPLLDISLSDSFGIDDAKIHVKNQQLLRSTLQSGASRVVTVGEISSSQSPSITTFENLADAIDSLPDSQVTIKGGSNNRSMCNLQQCSNRNLETYSSLPNVSNAGERVTVPKCSSNSLQLHSNNKSSVMQLHHVTSSEVSRRSTSRIVASRTTATGDSFMSATLPPISTTSIIGDLSTVVVSSVTAGSSSRVSNNNSTLNSYLNPNLNTTARPNKSAGLSALPLSETSTDRLFDIALGNSNSSSCFSSLLASVVNPSADLLDTSSLLNTPPRSRLPTPHPSSPLSRPSPPSSPSRLIPREEHQWMSGEVVDFSLSSLLGSLESPSKGGATQGETISAQTPPPVTLLAALNENGVDFTAKFDALSSDSLNGTTEQ